MATEMSNIVRMNENTWSEQSHDDVQTLNT